MDAESFCEDSPRLREVSEFLAEHYVRSENPAHKVDGHMLFRNHAVWANERELEHVPAVTLYNDLRTLGYMVRPGVGNRNTVYGIAEKATMRHAVACLEAKWSEVSMTIQERKAESRLERQKRIVFDDALTIRREYAEEALAVTLEIMRDPLLDPAKRLQAANSILDRSIPKLRTLAVEDEPAPVIEIIASDEEEEEEEEVIEVVEVPRVTVAEVEAIHAKILAERLTAAAAAPVGGDGPAAANGA